MPKSFGSSRPCSSATRLPILFAMVPLVACIQGCGTAQRSFSSASSLVLSASSSLVSVGQEIKLKVAGVEAAEDCTWSSSLPSVLVSSGGGLFQARASGSAKVVAQCGGSSATALVVVTSGSPGPITITHGGVYSGEWSSSDPQIPAVSIETNEPVTIKNSMIASRGDLISVQGSGAGANVTVENVTGTALDPQIAGLQRGNFVTASQAASLRVQHCTMTGVRFGVKLLSSEVTELSITQNAASELEDRESDGQGGFLTARPDLGHFVMLNQVAAPGGAEIAWNQVVDTIGQSSTEDVINIYKSQGAPGAPISVHDNYMEGYSSAATSDYTGSGLITDGDSNEPVTAYVNFTANEIVHTAGSGVEIAVGHDILAKNNRVVSCGIDAEGNWYAMPFVNAVVMWNYYGAPQFTNDRVEGTWGGMLRPAADGTPMIADVWVRTADLVASDAVKSGSFTDPCYAGGQLNLQAEDAERAFWQQKLTTANITPGDQHTF